MTARSQTPQHDHVTRLVSRYYEQRDGELYISGLPATELAAKFGTPLFVYDESVIRQKIRELRKTLPSTFQLYYSIKANPNGSILRVFLEEGCGLEIASLGELDQAIAAGCPGERLIFAGPGKREDELAAALRASIQEIHCESLEEARCLSELASRQGCVARVALRINPVTPSGGAMRMGGQASPFGIDEETLDTVLPQILALPRVRVVGVHMFMATQILDADTLIEQYTRSLAIARNVAREIPGPLETLDFGGGLGTPYFAHESELDLTRVAEGLTAVAAQLESDPLLSTAQPIVEPGRFLVNEAGIYLARVQRIKHSRGKTFVVLDGGMHHHLAASGNLGQTIKRNFPVAIVNRLDTVKTQACDVVGPLCTPLDALARHVMLPEVREGDLFGVFLSGAYARTSSPLGFLSHPTPPEILVSAGSASVVRRRGLSEDYLRDQSPSTVSQRSQTI